MKVTRQLGSGLAALVDLEAHYPDQLLDFIADCRAHDGLPYDRTQTREALHTALANPALARCWSIELDGQLAGYLAVSLGFSLEFGGKDAFLDELYVAPEFRRRGLASFALQSLDNFLQGDGVKAVHLEVHRDNHSAQAVYEGLGYERREQLFLMSRYLDS